ncbi:MAG: hypothetical protein GY866_31580 [Proteobacteria bacterium]|nr:hypothetical protein [Pseudomonadota bacterium]
MKAGKEIKELPIRKWEIKTKTGSSEIVDVAFHPDQGCNRHLLQIRECGLEQAVARLRGIHHQDKKNIILYSVPLDMEIDRLVAWKEFLNYGDERLDIIMDQFDFEKEVMPLTPGFMVARF